MTDIKGMITVVLLMQDTCWDGVKGGGGITADS